MEAVPWRAAILAGLGLALLLPQLCNGYPVNLENATADSHTQLLTGLVAVLLTVCSVVFLAGCLCCHRRNGFKEFHDSPMAVSTASNLDHGHVNPIANGEFTIFTPLAPPHQNNNVFLANQQIIQIRTPEDFKYGDVDVRSWFDGTEKDFPRNKLKYIRELGRGWFGKVVEGAAQVEGNPNWEPVVVRILDATSTTEERVKFLDEAAIYKQQHLNILKLVGRSLESIPLLLLQEYCQQGDLKAYLRNNQKTAAQLLSTEYPLVWACQLTGALRFLHERNITHRDLAARNCQLTYNLTLKLGDYGLGVVRYPEDYYQGSSAVPLRWCAPEALICTDSTITPNKITKEGNVWSLGVCLWEICSCGEQPYQELSDDEVICQVLGNGVRLQPPSVSVLYTDYIYRLMLLCWSNMESRPAVSQIDLMLADLLAVLKNASSSSSEAPPDSSFSTEDFDRRWEALKPNSTLETDTLEKPQSPSLNNLHGSLDNLSSLNHVPRIEFKLGPERTSSESETEDENWRKKIERGAYTEKVRLKSRSVADLMVLTHIDYSESESETPLPSLDSRGFKNVRYGPKGNLDVSLTFGSEGNLLSVQDTFQDELRKLQEERRDKDSLLFVPDSFNARGSLDDSPSKRLIQELSSAEIQPGAQVFNVFNVNVKFSPILTHIIHPEPDSAKILDQDTVAKITSDTGNSLNEECTDLDLEEESKSDTETNQNPNQTRSLARSETFVIETVKKEVPSLKELIESNDELMNFIIEAYDNPEEGEEEKVDFDLSEEALPNTLTHGNVYSSTPFGKTMNGSLEQEFNPTGRFVNLFPSKEQEEEYLQFSSNFNVLEDGSAESKNLNYSLETWDNFLGKSFDEQNVGFESFSSEPQSLLFAEDGTRILDDCNKDENESKEGWNKGGWFLHPQGDPEEVGGEMEVDQNGEDSYVGFSIDYDAMMAIRNELLNKLPHAQGGSGEGVKEEEEELEPNDRNEVFLKYNVYNTPLSPIPEEDELLENSVREKDSDEESSWSEAEDEPEDWNQTFATPLQDNRQNTLSQESCCSNDTLFNLEELNVGPEVEEKDCDEEDTETIIAENLEDNKESSLVKETADVAEVQNGDGSTSSTVDSSVLFVNKQVVPLPSPEDKPWKQLAVSLLSNDKATNQQTKQNENVTPPEYENIKGPEAAYENLKKPIYENIEDLNDIYNEADYVNVVNLENTKNSHYLDLFEDKDNSEGSNEFEHQDTFIINEDEFGVLADIRFNGPSENLMSTSFSESNDIDEQDWDSGSDTRSSSSGEFIWKEGEHEESLKALRAAPQDVLEDVKPMEGIAEESGSETDSCGSSDEEEAAEFVPSAWDKYALPGKSALRSPEKTLERIDPKAARGVWFKKQKYHCVYEYPKEPESPILQSRDLWRPPGEFCTFADSIPDWDFDGETYLPPPTDDTDIPLKFPNQTSSHLSSYQLTHGDSVQSAIEGDFFISSSSKPFDMTGSVSSQFFPGGWIDSTPDSGLDDGTPGSVNEFVIGPKAVKPLRVLASEAVNKAKPKPKQTDVLGGLRHTRDRLKLDLPPSPSAFTCSKVFNVEPLEGGIREKPSFSTFGKGRFSVQQVDTPSDDDFKNVSFEALPYKPIILPKGSSTDSLEDTNGSAGTSPDNVQYQGIEKHFLKGEVDGGKQVEFVRGEASLLDSADEDSGIESSTLERKLNQTAE